MPPFEVGHVRTSTMADVVFIEPVVVVFIQRVGQQPLVASAIGVVDNATVYDNSQARRPFRVIATFAHGSAVGESDWPAWTPETLKDGGQ